MIIAEWRGEVQILGVKEILIKRDKPDFKLLGSLQDYPSLSKLPVTERSPEDAVNYLKKKIQENRESIKDYSSQLEGFNKELERLGIQ